MVGMVGANWDRVPCSPGCPGPCYVAEMTLNFWSSCLHLPVAEFTYLRPCSILNNSMPLKEWSQWGKWSGTHPEDTTPQFTGKRIIQPQQVSRKSQMQSYESHEEHPKPIQASLVYLSHPGTHHHQIHDPQKSWKKRNQPSSFYENSIAKEF